MFNDREIKLGKIFGIRVGLDYSWFWILLLVIYTFSAQLLPALTPMEPIWRYLIYGVFSALLFFSSVLAHELAHSLVARAQGDNVDKITLFLFGGVANLEDEPKSATNEIKMAFVGPLTSVVIGFLLLLISYIFSVLNFLDIFTTSLAAVGYINFVLAIFNLLPGFPLDGGRIFRGLVWYFSKDLIKATKIAVVGGKVVAGLLVVYGIFQLVALGSFGGIWLVLIGLFLYQAARESLIKTMVTKKLEGIVVGDIIQSEPLTISKETGISEIREVFRKYRRDHLMVCDNNEPVGVISRPEVAKYSPSNHRDVIAGDIAKSLDQYGKIDINEGASKLINELVKGRKYLVIVEDYKDVINYLSLEDLRYYLSMYNLLEK